MSPNHHPAHHILPAEVDLRMAAVAVGASSLGRRVRRVFKPDPRMREKINGDAERHQPEENRDRAPGSEPRPDPLRHNIPTLVTPRPHASPPQLQESAGNVVRPG